MEVMPYLGGAGLIVTIVLGIRALRRGRGVGTNRRYPSSVADDIAARIPQSVSRPRPVSLSAEELDKDNTRVTTAPEPIVVRAWVRYPEAPVRTVARAVAWTPRAVLIEWQDPVAGATRAWVWASAVERLS